MSDPTTPRPAVPKPGVPKPSQLQPKARPQAGGPGAAPLAVPSVSIEEAKAFGRVAEDGTVFVRTAAGEREVGQYPDTTADEALTYYANKYADLVAAVAVLEQRVTAGSPAAQITKAAETQREALAEVSVVGDLDALGARLDKVLADAQALSAEQSEVADAAREASREARLEIVTAAEEIAAENPARVQWKTASKAMNELFDRWRSLQSSGPRLPRSESQELWGRFSKARGTFDKHRREYFAQLDQRNTEGKQLKEELIAEAEKLSTSTDWRETGAQYRTLMDRWKAAPRAGRKEDDALWARFRGAQDVFFQAREAQNDEIDTEYAANLVVKEELLTRAQALLPVKDLNKTKSALRVIQDKWEEAGKVPRGDVSRVEGALRAVERAVAEAEDDKWKKSNPETKARTEGALSQLDQAIADLEAAVEKARATGDETKLAKAEEALAARLAWREQIQKSAQALS